MNSTIGRALASARLDGTKLEADLGPAPKSLAQAYEIQDEMTDTISVPVVGWKIGANSPAARKRLNTDKPLYGPLFDRWTYAAPTRIPTPNGALMVVEVEIAFRLKRDLAARSEPFTEQEVGEAIGTVHPAIEIVDRRVRNTGQPVDAKWLIADGAANHAFVYGEGRTDWKALNLPDLAVSVSMDGKVMGTGTGAESMGGPLKALHWLAEELRQRGKNLVAGNYIITGSLAPVFEGKRGVPIIGEFGPLGQIEIVLA
ncbi:MAG: fumarylacetoacetate hydrolase family protein [Alphaproteobacteria bacterium]|nr:fumarylacetoacetate hydrolase family protein [Alphaproteobacteria bacterium]